MYATQVEAYRNQRKVTLSGRELEAEILTNAAQKLQFCQDHWDAADRSKLLGEALKYNQKIWTLFQSELTQPENPLPKKLKENLLNLSTFVDKRIFEIMSFPSPEKLKAIIDINLNIAAGLRNSAA